MSTYREILKELREISGLSTAKFAEQIGVPVSTYRSWELGKRQPSGSAKTYIKQLIVEGEKNESI